MERLSDLKKAAKEKIKPERPEIEPEEYAFIVRYRTRDGQVLEGEFVTHVLTVQEMIEVGRAKAVLSGGRPWEALDSDTRTLIEAAATCSVALKKQPQWFDTMAMKDPQLLLTVYGEVLAHEQRFFRTGVREGKEGQDSGVVEVVPLVFEDPREELERSESGKDPGGVVRRA